MRNLVLLTALTLPLTAQQPQVQNGQIITVPQSNLQAEMDALKREDATTWIAYSVPTSKHIQNCYRSKEVSYLEDAHWSEHDDSNDPTLPPYRALVLLRIANHAVQNIRVEEPGRKLDAGGTHIVYLPAVDPAQSVTVLQAIALNASTTRLRDVAIFALSIHQSPATVPALTALAAPDEDLPLREKAAFWLSTQYGKDALSILERWTREDKDDRFREKLTFDLTLVHQPAASDLLIRMAHHDPAPQVRKQAQFWMANLGGKRIATDLTESAANDPNEDVRKSAVFGLSRLPNGEGTPKLIDLAQSSKDPAVRKQAVFWLGQSNDPRALDYLTQLMKQ